MTGNFDTAFATFVEGCKAINKANCERLGFKYADTWSTSVGAVYAKVMHEGGVFCFVNKTTGDVLKAASWKAPAKHARGNIFDASNGLKLIGPYGPAYLR